jgi:microcystin-dependent protein
VKGAQLSNSRKTPRIAAAAAVVVCMLTAFAALGGVGLAQTSGDPGKSQYGKNKVTICHKGKKTITIARAALPAHKAHGDQEGTCAQVRAKKAKAAKAKAAKAKAAKAKAAAAKAKAAAAKAEKAKAKQESASPAKGKGKGK